MDEVKKKLLKALSVILVVVLTLTSAPLSGFIGIEFYTIKSNASTLTNGSIITLGSYPQTQVTNATLISSLNSIDATWQSYEYLDSNGERTDYIFYKDVTLNDNKYRAVTLTKSRGYSLSNGFSLDKTYWFKYEPLTWKILDSSTGLAVCEKVIDSQPYHHTSATTNGYYGNNYEMSDIREWLNNDFYNTSFDDVDKLYIKLTSVDNTATYSTYSATTTKDYIFALSRTEARDYQSVCGFYPTGTAYAKIQGYAASQSLWGLRTAGSWSCGITYVKRGSLDRNTADDAIRCLSMGVRPALCLYSSSESQRMLDSMTTFSHEEAIDFLSFLYNRKDEFEGTDITNDIQYKLLTGNLPADMSADEIKGLISAFLIVVETVLNENIRNSQVKSDFLADAMIKRLKKEVEGMSNLDEEIINSEMGKIGQLVEDGLLDIMTSVVWRATGVRVLGKYLDDINAVISGISSTKNVVSNVASMVNYALAAVDLYGVILGQENLARYTYFITYINNRDLSGEAFNALMDCQFDLLNLSYPLAETTDFFSSITGKSSWNEHRDTLDKWAEYVYQLSEYQSTDFHRYKETKYSSTCTSDGYTEYKCIYCVKEFTGNIIEAPGHKYTKTTITPTCEEQGYDLYQCKNCTDSYKDNYKDVAGHSVRTKTIISPTCTTGGYTLNICKCGYTWQADVVSALQHNYQQTIVEATEAKQGYTVNKCVNCNDTYNSDYTNPTGHEYTITTIAATCEQDGSITHTCDCGDTYSESISATGHKYVLDSYEISTCTSEGSKTYKCINCDSTYTETEEILEHDYTYKTEFVDSTCEEQGYSINYCQCGETSITDYIESLGHSYIVVETVNATCVSEGTNTLECELCGGTTTEVITALGDGHNYELIESSELSCETSQYELYECIVCEMQKYENISVFEGHQYDSYEIVAATCTTDGKITYTCNSCSEDIIEVLPALGHSIGVWECLDNDSKAIRQCTICYEILEETEDIHKIIWDAHDCTVIDYYEPEYVIAAPLIGKHEEYEFSYWSPDVPTIMGTEDLYFTAVYYNSESNYYLSQGFKFVVTDNTATVTGYIGEEMEIVIPDELGGYFVTSIGTNAFSENTTVKKVIINDNILSIEDSAFDNSTILSVVINSESCELYDDADTISSNIVIFGYENSTAEAYAEKYNKEFYSKLGVECIITLETEDAIKGTVQDSFTAISGEIITVEAEPTFKYEFYCWMDDSGNCLSNDEKYSFIVKESTTLIAHFSKRHRNITVEVENGTLSVPTTAEIESSVSVVPVEDDGYIFNENSITVNGELIDGNIFTMPDEDVVLSAEFVKNEYYFALKDAIAEAEAIDRTLYSEESISILDAIIASIKKSLVNNVTQEESETKIAELDSAINNLIPLNGVCGDDLTWNYNETTKTLTISGSGEMYSYENTVTPWEPFESKITTIYFERGISSIGDYSFSNCSSLTDVYYAYTEENWNTLSKGSNNDYMLLATLHCHKHDFVSSVTTKETCLETGELTYTCTCGDTYAEIIPATGHNYESVVTVPTCTSDGYTTYTCSECSDSYVTDEAEALGHTEADVVVENLIKETCLEDGSYDNVVYCSTCSAELSRESVTTPSLGGHTEGDWVITIAPTCLGAGERVKKCTACEVVLQTEVLPATGHAETEYRIVSKPSCKKTGMQSLYCTICDVIIANETIPMVSCEAGEWNIITQPTCTSVGKKTKQCIYCSAVLETEEISMTEHIVDEWLITAEPTCSSAGERVAKCVNCDLVLETEELPIKEHSAGYWEKATEATCVSKGEKAVKCTNCGVILETEEIPATGIHNISDWLIVTEPTTETIGESVKKCTTCDFVFESKEIPTLTDTSGFCGNDLLWSYDTETKTLTITGTGTMFDFTATTRPWEAFEDDMTAVVLGDEVTYIGRLAFYHSSTLTTIDMGGLTTIGQNAFSQCTGLKNVEIGKSVTTINLGAFNGCTVLESVIIPESVTTIGNTVFNNCKSLTDVYYASFPEQWSSISIGVNNTPLTNATRHYHYGQPHSYEEWNIILEASCTEAGSKTRNCINCGESETVEISALGHTESDWTFTVEVTCLSDGERIKTCTVCNALLKTETIVATGHSYEAVVTEPTCTLHGYTTYTCLTCNDTYVADETDSLGGHNVDDGVCKQCGEIIQSINFELKWDKEKYLPGETAQLSIYMNVANSLSLGNGAITIGLDSNTVLQDDNSAIDIKTSMITSELYESFWKISPTMAWQTAVVVSKIQNANTQEENEVYDQYLKILFTKNTAGSHENATNTKNGIYGYEFNIDEPIMTLSFVVSSDVAFGTPLNAAITSGTILGKPVCTYFKYYVDPGNATTTANVDATTIDISQAYATASISDGTSICSHNNTTKTESVTKQKTCTTDGIKTITITCDDCAEVVSASDVVIPAGHNYQSITTDNGYSQYVCSSCNNKGVILLNNDNHIEGLTYQSNTVEKLILYFNSSGHVVSIFNIENVELSNDDLVGTGATICIYDGTTNELLNTYPVILYGDVNGDGLINEADQEIITKVSACQAIVENEWCLMAADTNHDGAVDSFDVIETEMQTLDMHNIEQINNSAYIEEDSEDEEVA